MTKRRRRSFGAGRGIPSRWSWDPNLPPVAADSQRIVQVLNNLLSNASKYSAETSTIRVSASRDEFHVSVSVTDEGRGVPDDQLSNLFKKFSRVDGEGREREVAGEDLGLAICRGIVEAHGGRIWAESDGEERGTRVTFTIPEAAAAVRDSAGDTAAVRSGDQSRILAVDDEPQALWLLRNILSEHGYKPFGTGNPDEMMRLLEVEQPHLVLLDLMVPGNQWIRADEPHSPDVRRAGYLPVRERSGGERGEGPQHGSR